MSLDDDATLTIPLTVREFSNASAADTRLSVDELITRQLDLFQRTRLSLIADRRRHAAKQAMFMPLGAGSLHENWLRSPHPHWDFVAYCYDDTYIGDLAPDVIFRRAGSFNGTKFSAFARLLADHPEMIDNYDRWMLIDNDIVTSVEDVDAVFRVMRESRLDMAQPSLTDDSPCAWPDLKQKPGGTNRSVNAAEVMMFMLSKRAIQAGRHVFRQSISGFGLDLAIGTIVRNQLGTLPAVIDSVAMKHAKNIDQVDGALYSLLRREGISPLDELHHLQRIYRFEPAIFQLVAN